MNTPTIGDGNENLLRSSLLARSLDPVYREQSLRSRDISSGFVSIFVITHGVVFGVVVGIHLQQAALFSETMVAHFSTNGATELRMNFFHEHEQI